MFSSRVSLYFGPDVLIMILYLIDLILRSVISVSYLCMTASARISLQVMVLLLDSSLSSLFLRMANCIPSLS